MVAWRELVDNAVEVLRRADIPDPEISARRIGQEATGTDGADWLEALDRDATRRQLAAFDAMVERRRTGEPLQYVVGRWGFRTLDLFIDQRVLIPRPETEVVAGLALDEAYRLGPAEAGADPIVVVDLGTGSGAIGLAVAAEHPSSDVWLTDVSADALAVARANVAGLGRAGARVRAVEGSWFEALPAELRGRVGVIVSNPPYVDRADPVDPQVGWEPEIALFADPPTGPVSHLIEYSPVWLRDDGALVLEMAPDHTGSMAELADRYFSTVTVAHDLAGRPRAVVARHPKQG